MKTYFVFLSTILLLTSCSQSAKNKTETSDAQEAVQGVGEKLVVEATQSTIHWKGFKPGGSHHGTLGIQTGEVFIEGSQLKSGTFVLDMRAIINEDLTDEKSKEQLVGHLKGADFFDVEKYPQGKFTITQVDNLSEGADGKAIRISGNLELKGISKNISFNASVTKEGELYRADTDTFTIDRTQWGVNYGSKNIFKDLKDQFINDDMEISLVILAKKS